MVFSYTIESTTEILFIIEKYVPIPLILSLNGPMVLNGIKKYHWEYHWVLLKHLGTEWYWVVLQITIESIIESYLNTIEWSNGTEWYSVVFVKGKYLYKLTDLIHLIT